MKRTESNYWLHFSWAIALVGTPTQPDSDSDTDADADAGRTKRTGSSSVGLSPKSRLRERENAQVEIGLILWFRSPMKHIELNCGRRCHFPTNTHDELTCRRPLASRFHAESAGYRFERGECDLSECNGRRRTQSALEARAFACGLNALNWLGCGSQVNSNPCDQSKSPKRPKRVACVSTHCIARLNYGLLSVAGGARAQVSTLSDLSAMESAIKRKLAASDILR